MVAKNQLTLILILIIISLLGLAYIQNETIREQAQDAVSVSSALDTLTRSVNKKGEETVTRDAIILSDEKKVDDLVQIGPEFERIRREIKKLKGSLQYWASVNTTTEAAIIPDVEVVTGADSVPAVVVNYTDEWVAITMDEDTLKLLVRNEHDLAQTYRNPWFKKPITSSTWTNRNPYTRTDEFLTLDIQHKQKRTNFGTQIGVCLDATGRVVPCISAGIQLNLIPLK